MHLTEIRINLCPGSHHPIAARNCQSHANGHAGCSGHGFSANAGHGHGSRLRAFCSITFDDTFVVRDVKLIEGNDGLFLAMPSRKLTDHCPACREKNHLRARFCNQCGARLNDDRYLNYRQAAAAGPAAGASRLKLHADVAHPISARCRQDIERRVIDGYWREVERSKQPGYVPPSLDGEDYDFYDARPDRAPERAAVRTDVAPAALPVAGVVAGLPH